MQRTGCLVAHSHAVGKCSNNCTDLYMHYAYAHLFIRRLDIVYVDTQKAGVKYEYAYVMTGQKMVRERSRKAACG